MPFFILLVVFQVCLVIHILKTGRGTIWIWVIVMLPLAGSIAYLVIEILPDILGSKTGKAASRTLSKKINLNKDLKKAAQNFSNSDTVENTTRLASELFDRAMYKDASALYEKCLKGVHDTDPYIMEDLAKCYFYMGQYSDAVELLDRLVDANPEFKSHEAHLLYARSQEGLGHYDKAQHEYEALAQYYVGPEAMFRFAELSEKLGDTEKANALYKKIVAKADASGRHYYTLYKEFIKAAKKNVRT